MIRLSSAEHFAVKTGNDIHDALEWVPESKRTGKTVCD
jgi:hypothetical protein